MKKYVIIICLLFINCKPSKPLIEEKRQSETNTHTNREKQSEKNTIISDSIRSFSEENQDINIIIEETIIKFDSAGSAKEEINRTIAINSKGQKTQEVIQKTEESTSSSDNENTSVNIKNTQNSDIKEKENPSVTRKKIITLLTMLVIILIIFTLRKSILRFIR